MKEVIKDAAILGIFLALIVILIGCSYELGAKNALTQANAEKAALEIKILKHELAAYEAMEKELKSEN